MYSAAPNIIIVVLEYLVENLDRNLTLLSLFSLLVWDLVVI